VETQDTTVCVRFKFCRPSGPSYNIDYESVSCPAFASELSFIYFGLSLSVLTVPPLISLICPAVWEPCCNGRTFCQSLTFYCVVIGKVIINRNYQKVINCFGLIGGQRTFSVHKL
jgi:hypothetical protein